MSRKLDQMVRSKALKLKEEILKNAVDLECKFDILDKLIAIKAERHLIKKAQEDYKKSEELQNTLLSKIPNPDSS